MDTQEVAVRDEKKVEGAMDDWQRVGGLRSKDYGCISFLKKI